MKEASHGRKPNQKMKPYLVYQYILHNSDENTAVKSEKILDFLHGRGIEAERRSIYTDIDEINKAIWILDNDSNMEECQEAIDDGSFESEKLIIYDEHKKGFMIQNRKYDAFDIKLISECIYTSRYIAQNEAERLVDIMKEFVSDDQAAEIKTDALVTNRVRTINKSSLLNISQINDAMSKKLLGEKHVPSKITFQYLKSDINDLSHMIERKSGQRYSVSPYKLIINDGNYYLLAFDDDKQDMRTYRVDRMKNIKETGEARDGEAEFKKINLTTYTKRTFGMFDGDPTHVRIQFIMSLLDAAYERFGTKDATYSKIDDHHFVVSTNVAISDQFFGWICGFGGKAVIVAPESVKEQFKAFLGKISKKYQ